MPYHASSPMRSRNPMTSFAHSSGVRSRATCTVSLTSISACTSTSTAVEDDPAQVAPPPVLVLIPATDEDTTPFPTTTHFLLHPSSRSAKICTSNVRSTSSQEFHEPPSTADPDSLPPRKRARRTALIAPRVTSHRLSTTPRLRTLNSSPRRSPPVSQRRPSCSASSASSTAQVITAISPPSETDSPAPPESKLSLLTSPVHVSSKGATDTATASESVTLNSAPTAAIPTSSTYIFGRQRSTSEIKLLYHLCRTLFYGLEVRYANHSDLAVYELTGDYPDFENKSRPGTNLFMDMQEALFAQDLQESLIAIGVPNYLWSVDVEGMAVEHMSGMVENMDIDDDSTPSSGDAPAVVDSPETSSSTQIRPFQHPHLHSSNVHSIRSYQHLAAMLTLRHRTSPNRPQKARRQDRKPSTLVECFTAKNANEAMPSTIEVSFPSIW
ncbi:hypothetical protein B0H34DRAFT_856293 [Crassisporium funariophilum]|nr:hypothetical protein B0H34DRAFT_856293 [Crassisporium funariophilum]